MTPRAGGLAQRPAFLALVLVQAMFASNAIVGRLVLATVPPVLLVACRIFGAATAFLLINLARGGPWIRDGRTMAHAALCGLLGVAGNQALFVFGLSQTTAINATILTTTAPVFTVVGSLLAGQERPSRLKLAGIGLAGAGAVYLVGPERFSFGAGVAMGNLLVLLAMMFYAAYFLFSKPLLARVDVVTASTYVMVSAAFAVAPVAAPALAALPDTVYPAATWGMVVYLVLFPTVGAYFLNLWALRRVSPHAVAAFIYLQPFLVAVTGPFVLPAEQPTTRTLVAGLAIFAGLAVVLRAEGLTLPRLRRAGVPVSRER